MTIDDGMLFDDTVFAIDDNDAEGDTADVSEVDSGILVQQTIDPELLQVTCNNGTIQIAFHQAHLHDGVCLAAYRERVMQLANEPGCKKFQFDLSNIKILPSGMLGLMASLKKRGLGVDLINPSRDVRDVLQVMKMDSVFGILDSTPKLS